MLHACVQTEERDFVFSASLAATLVVVIGVLVFCLWRAEAGNQLKFLSHPNSTVAVQLFSNTMSTSTTN